MPEDSESTEKSPEKLSFENALGQLEGLVRDMESDQMPLEELIRNYEQGTRLFRVCEKRLEEAEGRIEIIRKNRNGEAVTEAFEETPETSESTPSSQDSSDEHGELF